MHSKLHDNSIEPLLLAHAKYDSRLKIDLALTLELAHGNWYSAVVL